MVKMDEKELLLKRSFRLGYEVGFYRHYEDIGWVRETRQQLLKVAERLEIPQEEVLAQYEQGKQVGFMEREKRGIRGVPGKGRVPTDKERAIELKSRERRRRRIKFETRVPTGIERVTQRVSLQMKPKLIDVPRVITIPSTTKLPMLLRLFD